MFRKLTLRFHHRHYKIQSANLFKFRSNSVERLATGTTGTHNTQTSYLQHHTISFYLQALPLNYEHTLSTPFLPLHFFIIILRFIQINHVNPHIQLNYHNLQLTSTLSYFTFTFSVKSSCWSFRSSANNMGLIDF